MCISTKVYLDLETEIGMWKKNNAAANKDS